MDATSSLSCETIRKHETKNDTQSHTHNDTHHNTHHDSIAGSFKLSDLRQREALNPWATERNLRLCNGGRLEFITVSLKIREPQSREGETDGFC